jgi:molybdopterin converting factor small subunit
MVHVHLSTALQLLTGGVSEAHVEAKTVSELISVLDSKYPGVAEQLASGVAVAINGDIYADAIYRSIPEGAEVHFVAAPSGG